MRRFSPGITSVMVPLNFRSIMWSMQGVMQWIVFSATYLPREF